jgi:hypothetical protein
MNLKDYIDKKLFRFFFFLIFIFTAYTYISNGFAMQTTWVECEENSILGCNNPYYCVMSCPSYCDDFEGICDIQTIPPGEVVGRKANFALIHYDLIVIILILILLFNNHIKYKKRGTN